MLAATRGAAILSKDEDFIALSLRRPEPVTVVWLRCGNIYNPELIALVETRLDDIVAAIARGLRLIEIR